MHLNARRLRVYFRWTTYLQGGVAKRTKATDCKSVIRGFESRRRLHSFLSQLQDIIAGDSSSRRRPMCVARSRGRILLIP